MNTIFNKNIVIAVLLCLMVNVQYGQSIYSRVTQQNVVVDPSVYPPNIMRFKMHHNFYSTRIGAYIDSNEFYVSNGQRIFDDRKNKQRKLADTIYGPENYSNFILKFADTLANITGLHCDYARLSNSFSEYTKITYSDSELNLLNRLSISKKILKLALYKYNQFCYNMIAIDTSQIYSFRITSKGYELVDSIPRLKIKGLLTEWDDLTWEFNFKFSNSGKVFGLHQRLSNKNTFVNVNQLIDTAIISFYYFDQASCKFGKKLNSFGFLIDRYSKQVNIERFHPFDFEISPNDSIIYVTNYSEKLNTLTNRITFNLYISQYNLYDNSKCNTFNVDKDILNGYFPLYFREHYLFIAPNGRLLLYRYICNGIRQNNVDTDTVTIIYDEICNPNVFGSGCRYRKDIARYEYLFTTADIPYYQMIQFPSDNFQRIHPLSFKYNIMCSDSVLKIKALGDGNYRQYNWQIDGKEYVGDSVSITYFNPGSLFVKLRGLLINGTLVETGDTINILPEYFKPFASFSINNFKQCQYTEVDFTNTSISRSNLKNYPKCKWIFGDGKDTVVSNITNFRHSYVREGFYRLQLIVENGYCRDTFNTTKLLGVQSAPQPGISIYSDTPICTWHPVKFGRKYTDFQDSIQYRINGKLEKILVKNEYFSEFLLKDVNSRIQQRIFGPNGCISNDSMEIKAYEGVRYLSRPEITLVDVIDDSKIEVRWDKVGQNFMKRLYHWPIFNSKNIDSVELSPNIYSKILTNNTQLSPFGFYIRTYDKCNNFSFPSSPKLSLYLAGKQNYNDYIDFNWNGVSRGNNNEVYKLIKLAPERSILNAIYDTTYRDKDIVDEFKSEVCYRVVRMKDSIFDSDARSNTLCFKLLPYLYVPNSFSPNGDNVNDSFQVRGFGINKFRIEIYNLWGEKVFASENERECWDGNYKGTRVSNGAYILRIYAIGNSKIFNIRETIYVN